MLFQKFGPVLFSAHGYGSSQLVGARLLIHTLSVELAFNSVISSLILSLWLNSCSQLKFLESMVKFLESMVMMILLFSDGRFFLYYRMSQWFALHDLSRMAEHWTVAGGFKYHPKIMKNSQIILDIGEEFTICQFVSVCFTVSDLTPTLLIFP